jgi:hypothetical protein
MSHDKVALKEGNSYTFKITGTLVMPDGSESFVLSDPNKVKHLIHKHPYEDYNFKNNQEIICRIDKINCTGKIFIEPEHPHYKLGETYNFRFYTYLDMTNASNEVNKIAIFTDLLGNPVKISADDVPLPMKTGDILACVVSRIRKGRVFITNDVSDNDFTGMVPGELYDFSILEELALGDNYNFYILENKQGKRFKLRKKFYTEYFLYIGKRFRGRLNGNNGNYYLEPVHPKYSVGETYDFEILKEGIIDEYPNLKKKAYFLKNEFGKDIVIKKEDVNRLILSNSHIKCKVIEIKRSQVYIDCK